MLEKSGQDQCKLVKSIGKTAVVGAAAGLTLGAFLMLMDLEHFRHMQQYDSSIFAFYICKWTMAGLLAALVAKGVNHVLSCEEPNNAGMQPGW